MSPPFIAVILNILPAIDERNMMFIWWNDLSNESGRAVIIQVQVKRKKDERQKNVWRLRFALIRQRKLFCHDLEHYFSVFHFLVMKIFSK